MAWRPCQVRHPPCSGGYRPRLAPTYKLTHRDLAGGDMETDRRAVDIFQLDLAICGGITEALRIAALASAHQIRLALHLWGASSCSPPGCSVCRVAGRVHRRVFARPQPAEHELTAERFPVKDGRVEVPDRPDLGLTLDEDFVAQYAIA